MWDVSRRLQTTLFSNQRKKNKCGVHSLATNNNCSMRTIVGIIRLWPGWMSEKRKFSRAYVRSFTYVLLTRCLRSSSLIGFLHGYSSIWQTYILRTTLRYIAIRLRCRRPIVPASDQKSSVAQSWPVAMSKYLISASVTNLDISVLPLVTEYP